MALTITEAARAKGISRNAVWLAMNRDKFTCRKTSGGFWLIEEDDKWCDYRPRRKNAKRQEKGCIPEKEERS